MIGANIGKFLNDIGGLVESKTTTDIVDITNQSSKEGIRIVLELKKGADTEQLTNMLYKKTRLEDTFGVNMLAVADGRLTDEELRQAKASVALAEIRENGLAAQGKLLENAMDGMVSYDPVSCVNQIAQMRLLDQKIAEHYKKCVDSGAEVSPEPFQLQVLGGAPTTEAALRELDKGFKPILEQFVAQKSDLDLVNEWVGPAPSAPKKETAAVKEQPPKAKVEKKAPSAESKTDAEIRQDMKKKHISQ